MAEAEGSAPVTEQQAPETPAPQTEETPASTDQGAEAGAGQGEAVSEADWQKQLDELAEKAGKDFWSHPKIAGRVGQLAQSQSQRDTSRAVEAYKSQQEAARLEELRKTSEVAWAREKARIEDSQKEASAGWGEFIARYDARFRGLPDEIRKPLEGKDYSHTGSLRGAQDAFLADLVDAESDAKATDKATKLLDKEREAIREAARKEALAKQASGEHVPDLSAGSHGAAEITQEAFNKNRKNRDWVDSNFDAINRAVAKGAIRY